MNYGIVSCIPILILIAGVIITKKLPAMLILSSLAASLIVFRLDFLSSYINMLYAVMSNGTFQFVILILIGFGALITNLEKTGALLGFSDKLGRFATNAHKSLVITWILGAIVFIDDYLNALAVAMTMRGITDKHRVPREHLAYTVNTMGACMCVLIPFSSWAAFMIGVMDEYHLGFTDYLKAMPFMFYPICALIIAFLLAVGILPKVGAMKRAYTRVENGGTLIPDDDGEKISGLKESEHVKPSSIWNFILPMAALVIGMICFDNSLLHGIIIAIFVQFLLCVFERLTTPGEFVANMVEGICSMAGLSFTILLAFTLMQGNDALGFTGYVIDLFTRNMIPALLPFISFALCAFISFTTGTLWPLIIIVSPIFIPLAQNLGINPALIIGGMMSGVALGSQSCFYVDAVFMTSAGCNISPLAQVKAGLPYVGIGVAAASVLFLAAGFLL